MKNNSNKRFIAYIFIFIIWSILSGKIDINYQVATSIFLLVVAIIEYIRQENNLKNNKDKSKTCYERRDFPKPLFIYLVVVCLFLIINGLI